MNLLNTIVIFLGAWGLLSVIDNRARIKQWWLQLASEARALNESER